MKTIRRNFKINYALACAKDSLRPALNCVYFTNGYIYATDAHILVRCPLDLHNIMFAEKLEGKFIHRDTFSKIYKYHIIHALDDGIDCFDRAGRRVAKYYYENIDNFPSAEVVIENAFKAKDETNVSLCFMPKYMKALDRLLLFGRNGLNFKPKVNNLNLITTIDSMGEGQVFLLMGLYKY